MIGFLRAAWDFVRFMLTPPNDWFYDGLDKQPHGYIRPGGKRRRR